MTSVPAAMAAHLEQDVTTVCHCWRLARTDGVTFGFTDHDRRLAVDGVVFDPGSGLAPSEARQTLGLSSDANDVVGALTSQLIRDEDIDAGIYDRAEVETLLVNWRDPYMFMSIRKSLIGKISRVDGRFTAELESVVQNVDQPNGRYFRKACDAELGDELCGFDLGQTGFRGSGSIVSVEAANRFKSRDISGFTNGWFANGLVIWTSGANVDRSARILEHKRLGAETFITVELGDCQALAVGDQFEIVAGCDKRFATCKAKFANAENFRGFPHLPGNDAAYAYARAGLIFDGRPLVP